jgi:hypothetical protein
MHSHNPSQKERTRIHVVCSPHTHVGTTLVARLLTDFLISENDDVVAFDTNYGDPHLASVFPREVKIINLDSTRDQMSLFDSLIDDDGTAKVVDLWHASFDKFYKQASDIGFFEEARSRDLKCFVLLMMDPRERFAPELSKIRTRYPGVDVVLVENEWSSEQRRASNSTKLPRFDHRRLFVPKLNQTVRDFLQHPEILICRFVYMQVPHELQALQDQFKEPLRPIFEQFAMLETATQLGLAARSLLPRKHSPQT